VREYSKKYFRTPPRLLANLIYTENQTSFKNIDEVRDVLKEVAENPDASDIPPEHFGYPGLSMSRSEVPLRRQLAQVARMLLANPNIGEVEDLIVQAWGVRRGRAREYIRLAHLLWQADFEKDFGQHASKSVAWREEIIRRCMMEGDHRTALAAMQERDKILGIYIDRSEIRGSIQVNTIAEAILSASVVDTDGSQSSQPHPSESNLQSQPLELASLVASVDKTQPTETVVQDRVVMLVPVGSTGGNGGNGKDKHQ